MLIWLMVIDACKAYYTSKPQSHFWFLFVIDCVLWQPGAAPARCDLLCALANWRWTYTLWFIVRSGQQALHLHAARGDEGAGSKADAQLGAMIEDMARNVTPLAGSAFGTFATTSELVGGWADRPGRAPINTAPSGRRGDSALASC
jgi:hypothetical protein